MDDVSEPPALALRKLEVGLALIRHFLQYHVVMVAVVCLAELLFWKDLGEESPGQILICPYVLEGVVSLVATHAVEM